MAALAEVYVTQISQISQIFLRCYACRGWGGLNRLLAALTKSWESGRLFPCGDFFRVRGWLNLVDFYKVSLAARDGLGLMLARVRCHTDCTDITDFSALLRLQVLARTYSPCPAGRNLVNLINLFLRDSVRVRG